MKESRTHYPLELSDELELIRQEALLVWFVAGDNRVWIAESSMRSRPRRA